MRSLLGPAGPQEPFPIGAAVLPKFSNRGTARIVEPSVHRYEIHLNGSSGQPGQAGKMWLYLPEGRADPRSLPCVLVAPAGTPLVTGMDLGDGDVPEHVPYVRTGFAVLAYELDGVLHDAERASDAQFTRAIDAFRKSSAGLVNAEIAIEYALTQVPEINPHQLYVVGHSSAATHALLFAAHKSRLKGCAAFAPCVDLPKRLGGAGLGLSLASPGIRDFIARSSPRAHEERLNCPVLLFHAMDDTNVPVSESQQCAARLERLGKKVSFVTVPSGDHYYSMTEQGIPTAISWLTQLGAEPKPPIRGAAASSRPAANAAVSEATKQREEEAARRREEGDREKANRDAKLAVERDKLERGVKTSGPGWELTWPKDTPDYVLTHYELGYRLHVPPLWEISRPAENVSSVVPSAERKSVIALAPWSSHSGGLGSLVRIETFAADGDTSPAELLKKWERGVPAAERRKSSYQRVGSVTEYKLGTLPAAKLVYTIRDQKTNSEFEINVVRRDDTIFAVTAGCVNDWFVRQWKIDDIRKTLQSFELIAPRQGGGSSAPDDEK